MKPPPWKILWIKTGPLLPADTGGKIRTLNMLTEMNRLHEVDYLSLQATGEPLHPDEAAAPYAREKIWISKTEPKKKSLPFFIDLAASLLSSKPFALSKYESAPLRQRLIKLDASGGYDLIVCDFLAPALNFESHAWRTPTILFQHNMESQIWKRMAANGGAVKRAFLGVQFRRMFAWEQHLSRVFDGVITVSAEDSRFAREQYALTNVLGDVPSGVDTEFFKPDHPPHTTPPRLAFLGSMDWMPNIEGLLWFVREAWPQLRAAVPDIRLRVIGRRPGAEIRALAQNDASIEVTGTVDDVRPHLHDATSMIVPLLSGGGTRIKILEAMAFGLPVISTTIGAEGLPFENGRHLILADEADTFAARCADLIRSPELHQRIAEAARLEVVDRYSWAAAAKAFLALCQRL